MNNFGNKLEAFLKLIHILRIILSPFKWLFKLFWFVFDPLMWLLFSPIRLFWHCWTKYHHHISLKWVSSIRSPGYYWCRKRHELEALTYYKMAPFGIGGGTRKYYLKCKVCGKEYDSTEEEYKEYKESENDRGKG